MKPELEIAAQARGDQAEGRAGHTKTLSRTAALLCTVETGDAVLAVGRVVGCVRTRDTSDNKYVSDIDLIRRLFSTPVK
jgi:hypothetical protein